jgi:hypothetical protein
VILANVIMAPGTSRAVTEATLARLDQGLREAERGFGLEPGELVAVSEVRLGEGVQVDPRVRRPSGDHVGGLQVELIASDRRDIRTSALIDAWREALPPLPGVESLTITERLGGPPGREIDIRLQGGSRPRSRCGLCSAACLASARSTTIWPMASRR